MEGVAVADDPIVELQARTLIEFSATIDALQRQLAAREQELARLQSLVDVYRGSRAVRVATFLQKSRDDLLHQLRRRKGASRRPR